MSDSMTRRQTGIAICGAVAVVLLIQAVALAVVAPFDATYEPVEDPSDPSNGALYLGAIIIVTAGMLAAFRYDLDRVIRAAIVLTSGLLSWYVFSVILPPIATLGGLNAPALVASGGIVGLLAFHPEWYVIDLTGILIGGGAAALLGISFTPLPAILLLLALAVYDAISVYGTEHMLSLAGGVIELRVPVVLVIPLTWGFSFRDHEPPTAVAEATADGTGGPGAGADPHGTAGSEDGAPGGAADSTSTTEDPADAGAPGRDAIFLGLGDAVVPTVLIASAATFPPGGAAPGVSAPVIGAVAGTTIATVGLILLVARGRAHAGLPLLNGGAIGGYLIGALASGVGLHGALGL